MDLTRRSFLRNLGFTLGGLVLAACSRQPRPTPTDLMPSCYAPTAIPPTKAPTATPTPTFMITCYVPAVATPPTDTPVPTSTPTAIPTPTPAARLDQLRALRSLRSLRSQARLLDGVSTESGLDPVTVARVRAAIERDAAALAPRGLAARLMARLLGLPV